MIYVLEITTYAKVHFKIIFQVRRELKNPRYLFFDHSTYESWNIFFISQFLITVEDETISFAIYQEMVFSFHFP